MLKLTTFCIKSDLICRRQSMRMMKMMKMRAVLVKEKLLLL